MVPPSCAYASNPDKIHIDSHEPQLTNDELRPGKHFGNRAWRAADDEKERAKAAWQQLAERRRPPRAAWIAHSLKTAKSRRSTTSANPRSPDKPL
jgi:hypothetical protein